MTVVLRGAPAFFVLSCLLAQDIPRNTPNGFVLPNGWRLSPAGKTLPASDMVLNLLPAPDGKALIGIESGYNDEGLVVIDPETQGVVQHIVLDTTWLGLAWSPDGKRLFVSGGNGAGTYPAPAPIRAFAYSGGRLKDQPVLTMNETLDPKQVFWSGLVHDPKRDVLYALNRGTASEKGAVVAFDSTSGKMLGKVPVDVNPYSAAISPDGKTLYVSNWASASVSVIDAAAGKVVASISVDRNPNDLALAPDGRLFVACSNDNSVVVIDTKDRQIKERVSTALSPKSPPGSTPNALALDWANKLLYVANADNNDVAVVHIEEAGRSEVVGFIPTGWYPSAVALDATRPLLYIGNSKGFQSFALIPDRVAPSPKGRGREQNSKDLRRGGIQIVDVSDLKTKLAAWTKQVYDNTPYKDELLAQAKAAAEPSVIPRDVGAASPIKHVVYIIKENRTYDQVLGDMPKGNGDASLVLFGAKVSPNHHAIADQFVLLDNLYADGEVSAEGHSWSDAAYATDFATKRWPVIYSGRSRVELTDAYIPSGGFIWDACNKKGLTYRTYGEYGVQVSGGNQIEDAPGSGNLRDHVAPGYRQPGMRDTDNAAVFLKELAQWDKNFEATDPKVRMPNFTIMSLPEDHTRGTSPGSFTPWASVASNDLAFGQIVEGLSHSRYWPEMAIFVIEDDAQDGPDHVDARRTVGFAISPYIKRGTVDSTHYTTSSMLRTMELLLGLPPMTQFDAAATPMYASFGTTADPAPYRKKDPEVDLNARNTSRAYGAKRSKEMDFDDVDRAPMYALNEILWKSIKGARSPMPVPVHRYLPFAEDGGR